MSTQAEKIVCRASYCKVFSGISLVSEFFNSHSPFHSLAPPRGLECKRLFTSVWRQSAFNDRRPATG